MTTAHAAPRLSAAEAVRLVRPTDTVLAGFAAGQPNGLLDALAARTDLEAITLFLGLLVQPSALLSHPAIRIVSGFFGPVERAARAAGSPIEYLPADFHGLERLALRLRPRVVLATTTPPDADGWLSFGLTAGAHYRPFLEATRDPDRVAIAEVNARMPRIGGLDEHGGHRVHVSALDAWIENEADLVTLPAATPSAEDQAIAERVVAMIEPGATVQFGIGGIPDEIARQLATDAGRGDLGVHTEMISDGVMRLHEAGKVTNRKPLHDGLTIATFALGSQTLYDWLARTDAVRMLPVSAVNDPALLRQLPGLVSVNGAMAIDLTGQIAADHVGGRQYSGVGGHEAFVIGASEAPDGRSIIALRSTATVHGERRSTIVPRLPADALVTTARHHVHWVVTEHGAVDLSTLGDRSRADALVALAHPDFREALRTPVG